MGTKQTEINQRAKTKLIKFKNKGKETKKTAKEVKNS